MSCDFHQEFKADSGWFHVFKAMVNDGHLASLTGSSVKVYLVLKSHTNPESGDSFPKLETIAQKAGISVPQVKRELERLAAAGYVLKSKVGRKSHYRLKEKIQIKMEDGRPAALASWDYVPRSVRAAVDELKDILVTGDLTGGRVIHIERLQVNIINAQDNAVVINVQDLDRLPPDLKKALENIRKKLNEQDVEPTKTAHR